MKKCLVLIAAAVLGIAWLATDTQGVQVHSRIVAPTDLVDPFGGTDTTQAGHASAMTTWQADSTTGKFPLIIGHESNYTVDQNGLVRLHLGNPALTQALVTPALSIYQNRASVGSFPSAGVYHRMFERSGYQYGYYFDVQDTVGSDSVSVLRFFRGGAGVIAPGVDVISTEGGTVDLSGADTIKLGSATITGGTVPYADSAGVVNATFKPTTAGTADSTGKVGDGSIGALQIATSGVGTLELGPGAVTGPKIAEQEWRQLGLHPAGDSLYTSWTYDGPETLLNVVSVDENNDTLVYSQYKRLDGDNARIRLVGLYGPGDSTCLINPANGSFVFPHPIRKTAYGTEWESDGAAPIEITNYAFQWLVNDGKEAFWRESWLWKGLVAGPATHDTLKLDIVRETMMRRGEPYVSLKYRVRSWDTSKGGDTLRIVSYYEPRIGHLGKPRPLPTGFAGNSANYDRPFLPGRGYLKYGQSYTDTLLASIAGGIVYGAADVGNPCAAGDTLENGTGADWNTGLKTNMGSGTKEWLASFVAWNTDCDIWPNSVSVQDTSAFAYQYLAWATDSYNRDTTACWDEPTHDRVVMGRSDIIPLGLTDYKTFEFVLGRARISGAGSIPRLPEVIFQDGSILQPRDTSTR